MDIVKIAVLGIAGVFLAIPLKREKGEYSTFVAMVVGICIFIYLLTKVETVLLFVDSIKSQLLVDCRYIGLVVKMVGITYVSEFAANLCRDSGYSAIAGQIEMFAKLSILVVSVPVFGAVLTGMPVTVQATDYDGGTGSAEKTQETYLKTFLEDLDFAELDTWTKEELFPEQREKFSFSVMVQELLADGIGVTSMEKIGQWLCDALLYEIKTGKTILVEVVLLAAGFSMLKNFSGTFEKNYVSDICFLLVYGVLCVLLLKSFEIYGTVAEEALNGSIDFMKALIPAFGISMVFSSGAESSAAFYQLAFLVIYLVEWLFLSVLLPFIRVYVVTELFNHFFEDEKFQNFTELLAGVISWGMKSAMMAVLGLNVMQGLLAPSKDRLLNGAVSRAAMMIPGVGNVLGGIGELMFGAGILIKNCVGVTALIVLLAVGCIPVLKLACMSVLYKLAAAVAEPVADKRIVGCIKSMAQGGVLYLKLVCYGIVLFFATIALQTAAVTSHA